MGHLAHSTDVRAFRLEAEVPRMIERVITIALTPLKASIEALTSTIKVCEKGQGATDAVTVLKTDVSELRKDMDHLKSTNFTLLFGMAEISDDQSVDVLEHPTYAEVPPSTIGDDTRDDIATAEFEAETDEDQLENKEKNKDNNMQKGTKQAEDMEKSNFGDHQDHSVSRRVALQTG
ncbi:uncharacterized protein LOC125837560 [Solanum verrucosum]|uniref:uncharacterized protein LOC125837560 n=1 Tax=Solanum verrucosum TaxID=315347 RepID=UPI0020D0937C|nr:uncharacterized protein LOC125837560 [Solanum verrucosum]